MQWPQGLCVCYCSLSAEPKLAAAAQEEGVDTVLHLAAQSHVDLSFRRRLLVLLSLLSYIIMTIIIFIIIIILIIIHYYYTYIYIYISYIHIYIYICIYVCMIHIYIYIYIYFFVYIYIYITYIDHPTYCPNP